MMKKSYFVVEGRLNDACEHEFVPGLVLPKTYHGVLRKRLTEISCADGVDNCLIAHARAQGMVDALELLKVLESTQVERLHQLLDQTRTARLRELQLEQAQRLQG